MATPAEPLPGTSREAGGTDGDASGGGGGGVAPFSAEQLDQLIVGRVGQSSAPQSTVAPALGPQVPLETPATASGESRWLGVRLSLGVH